MPDHLRGAIPHALTPRERDVLVLIAAGNTNREIAAALCISSQTVKNHVMNVMHKLRVTNRVAAVVKAIQTGMIPFPPME